MTFELRLATTEDIPALVVLIPTSARALSAGSYTEQQIESALTSVFGVDSQLISDETFFVATSGNLIVGCGGWSKRKTLYGGDAMKTGVDPELDPRVDAARIRAFFVHPEWARRGIGRRIIEACEAAARTAGFTRMELGATLVGQQLYASMGYVATGPIEIVMPDGVTLPATHMAKAI